MLVTVAMNYVSEEMLDNTQLYSRSESVVRKRTSCLHLIKEFIAIYIISVVSEYVRSMTHTKIIPVFCIKCCEIKCYMIKS